MLNIEQVRDIEFLAKKGKAVASLLAMASGTEECTQEDINMSAYILEQYFAKILKTLEPVPTGPQIK